MPPNHVYVSKQPVPHEKVGCPSRNMAFCTRYSYSLLIVACLETSILLAPAAFPGVATYIMRHSPACDLCSRGVFRARLHALDSTVCYS